MPIQPCEIGLIERFIIKKYDVDMKLIELMVIQGNKLIEVITDKEKLKCL
jgi:hypothetical protein